MRELRLIGPTESQLEQSRLEKERTMQVRREQLEELKVLLRSIIVDSNYAPTVEFGNTIEITHFLEETQLAVDAQLLSIVGTVHTIRLEQPYTKMFQHGPEHYKGTLRIPSIEKEDRFDLADAKSCFKSAVRKLIESDGLPFPIKLTHPPPVGNAPFDPYGEREEEYVRRVMMDFNKLKALVQRMLLDYGYSIPYTVGPDEPLADNALGVSFYITRARDGTPDIIRLKQPALHWTNCGPYHFEGSIITPYAKHFFNADDFEEVFRAALREFVQLELFPSIANPPVSRSVWSPLQG